MRIFLEQEVKTCVDTAKNKFRILGEISRGGQGAVYRTQLSNVVIKLELENDSLVYANTVSNDKFLSLRLLPLPRDLNITLPISVLEKYSGYTMQMMDDMTSFKSAFPNIISAATPLENAWLEQMRAVNPNLAMIFYRLIKIGGLRRIFQAYCYAARIMAEIHSVGLVYCDFSPNNVFISKGLDQYNVWFIDADNLDFQANTVKIRVHTPGVGAPEICDDEVAKGCTFYSDSYAFAASFFQQLTCHHQFEGAAYEEKLDEGEIELEDLEQMRDRGDFVWIFDEDDDSNFWEGGAIFQQIISPEVMQLFNQTFSAGLFKPVARPLMSEWSYTLAKTVDKFIRCPKCKMDRYGNVEKCSWCDHVHSVIEIFSYFENGEEFWHFTKEIEEDEIINLPLRIVHGWRANEVDDIAFKFKISARKLIIQKSTDKFKTEFQDKNTSRKESSGFETFEKDFNIYCRCNKNFSSVLKVRVVNAD